MKSISVPCPSLVPDPIKSIFGPMSVFRPGSIKKDFPSEFDHVTSTSAAIPVSAAYRLVVAGWFDDIEGRGRLVIAGRLVRELVGRVSLVGGQADSLRFLIAGWRLQSNVDIP